MPLVLAKLVPGTRLTVADVVTVVVDPAEVSVVCSAVDWLQEPTMRYVLVEDVQRSAADAWVGAAPARPTTATAAAARAAAPRENRVGAHRGAGLAGVRERDMGWSNRGVGRGLHTWYRDPVEGSVRRVSPSE